MIELKHSLDTLHNFAGSISRTLRRVPKKYVFSGMTIVVVTLVAVGLWPRTVEFSYGSAVACVGQPTILPSLLKSKDSDTFSIKATEGNAVIGNKICVNPLTAPDEGQSTVMLSILGLPIGKTITVRVPERPIASADVLAAAIPVSKPLQLQLDQPDNLFNYRLTVGESSSDCPVVDATIRCDVAKLGLAQGAAYPVALDRLFEGKKVATVISQQVKTLSAVSVKETTIKRDDTVYSKLQSADLTLDKKVTKAVAKLEKVDGDTRTPITAQVSVDGEVLHVSWPEEQERQKGYELTVESVEAGDGSSLVEPYKIPFMLSGGPKVSGVSVPKTGVPVGSTAVITFDQPLLDTQDITKAITLSGGATIASVQGNQVRISLAGTPKCADFSIKLGDGLQSNHGVSGGSNWSFNGRMLCHSIETIGYSSKGRAITAYTFGSGVTSAVYTGAIHGNEVSTRSLMLRWIDELEANARSIPEGTSVVVVPMINPDGIAAGSRVSGANVDLNRNFGTSDWKKDITTVTNAPFPGGGGSAPLSEPESKAIANLIGRLRPGIVLSYHSIGGLLQANMAGNSTAKAAQYSSLSGYRNATGGSAFEYSITGTADDYYAERFGVGSIVIELGSHTYHQFERNQKAMWAMLK